MDGLELLLKPCGIDQQISTNLLFNCFRVTFNFVDYFVNLSTIKNYIIIFICRQLSLCCFNKKKSCQCVVCYFKKRAWRYKKKLTFCCDNVSYLVPLFNNYFLFYHTIRNQILNSPTRQLNIENIFWSIKIPKHHVRRKTRALALQIVKRVQVSQSCIFENQWSSLWNQL